MGLWNVIIKSFKEPSIRKKILMTLLLILIFRIGCFIPVPGLASGALNGLAGTGLFSFMDLIGGGAMSGKDPSKVDRSGAYAARKIARDIVSAGYADKAEVQIAYAIGVAEPVSVYVETFGTEHQDTEFISQYVRENYDLTPRGIIENLGLLDVDYNKVSAYGHFGKSGLPWEK